MGRAEEIRQLLDERSSRVGPSPTMLATVQSVDTAEATCVLYDEETDLEYYDVRLRPVIDDKESFTIFPKKGSWCLAARIENTDEWMVLACSEADKWRLKIDNSVVEQDATGLLIQKQSDTLRQALELIIQAVMKVVVVQGQNPDYAKLQQALTKIQNILR
jgi:hypothetical protein